MSAKNSVKSLFNINAVGRLKDAGMGFLNGTKKLITNTVSGVRDTMKLVKNKTIDTIVPYLEGVLAFTPRRKSYAPQIASTLQGRAK